VNVNRPRSFIFQRRISQPGDEMIFGRKENCARDEDFTAVQPLIVQRGRERLRSVVPDARRAPRHA
jgi:hypothetical protein